MKEKYKLGEKGLQAEFCFEQKQLAKESAEAAWKKSMEQSAEQAAKRAGRSILGRLAKAGKTAIPFLPGVIVSLLGAPSNAQEKGGAEASADVVLDNIPYVEWAKAGTELIWGVDWIPAPGKPGFFDGMREPDRLPLGK